MSIRQLENTDSCKVVSSKMQLVVQFL